MKKKFVLFSFLIVASNIFSMSKQDDDQALLQYNYLLTTGDEKATNAKEEVLLWDVANKAEKPACVKSSDHSMWITSFVKCAHAHSDDLLLITADSWVNFFDMKLVKEDRIGFVQLSKEMQSPLLAIHLIDKSKCGKKKCI